MLSEFLRGILVRDLKGLKRELEAFSDEKDIWKTAPGITNTAGNLAMHLTGNLQHFIGAQMGGTGYVRNRDAEFARTNVPRTELLAEIDVTIAVLEKTLPKLTDTDLAKQYALPIGGVTLTTGDFFTHLAVHFAYHLGQLDYLRRFVTGEAGKTGVILPTELSSAKKAG